VKGKWLPLVHWPTATPSPRLSESVAPDATPVLPLSYPGERAPRVILSAAKDLGLLTVVRTPEILRSPRLPQDDGRAAFGHWPLVIGSDYLTQTGTKP
jgi:hypothetical protein